MASGKASGPSFTVRWTKFAGSPCSAGTACSWMFDLDAQGQGKYTVLDIKRKEIFSHTTAQVAPDIIRHLQQALTDHNFCSLQSDNALSRSAAHEPRLLFEVHSPMMTCDISLYGGEVWGPTSGGTAPSANANAAWAAFAQLAGSICDAACQGAAERQGH